LSPSDYIMGARALLHYRGIPRAAAGQQNAVS
jgi:hypothetical protein